MKHSKPARLYQFYNWEVGKKGEVFTLCDKCIKEQPIPSTCVLQKIANDSCRECQGVG